MKMTQAMTLTLAATMALTPVSRARADTGSFVAGAALGGLLGHLATRNTQPVQAPPRPAAPLAATPTPPAKPAIPATAIGRDIQAALLFFGFDAGAVDGQIGPQTRAAISAFQVFLGDPATGALTPEQQAFLFDAHARGKQAKVPPGSEPARALLRGYRGGHAAATPAELPQFQVSARPDSLTAHCDLVRTTPAADAPAGTPVELLDSQFCQERSAAIDQAHALLEQVSGTTPEAIRSECAVLGQTFGPVIDDLPTTSRDAITRRAALIVSDAGADPQQMIGVGQVCLGLAYEDDRMDVALASAVMLTALGRDAYAEIVGHHIAGGFGVPATPDQAVPWYQTGFAAIEGGQPPVVRHIPLADLKSAVAAAYGTPLPISPADTAQKAAVLPTFMAQN